MMNLESLERQELRVELTRIMTELKKPLPAIAHSIKPLKGGDLYIYVNWEEIRDRLDEVVPDYALTFEQPALDIATNTCTVVATLSVLGVSKSALASVSISELSSKGSEMTRGSAVDRCHSEALKNVAEAWGLGRYLSDQYYTWTILDKEKGQLSEDYRGKLNIMASQLKAKLGKGEVRSLHWLKKNAGLLPKEGQGKAVTQETSRNPSKKPELKVVEAEIAKPAATTQVAVAEPQHLYPQHRTMANDLMQDFKSEGLKACINEFVASAQKQHPGDLDPHQMGYLIGEVAAYWAWKSGHCESRKLAFNAWDGYMSMRAGGAGNSLSLTQQYSVTLEWKTKLIE